MKFSRRLFSWSTPSVPLLFVVILVLARHTNMLEQVGESKLPSDVQFHRTVVGETLVLPCQFENLGSTGALILWKRGKVTLTVGDRLLTRDARLRLIEGFNLQMTPVIPQDAGSYVCQLYNDETRDQIHTVEVLVPASVIAIPKSNRLSIRIGNTANMLCRVYGNPTPTVSWIRLSDNAKIGEGEELVMKQVNKESAGKYTCIVGNGISPPIHQDFILEVTYPPKISLQVFKVKMEKSFHYELVCTVEANPVARVSWYKDWFPIKSTDRIIISSHLQKASLLIMNVLDSDYGNYSCVAENSLDISREFIKLSKSQHNTYFQSILTRCYLSLKLWFSQFTAIDLDRLKFLLE